MFPPLRTWALFDNYVVILSFKPIVSRRHRKKLKEEGVLHKHVDV